MRRSNLVLDNLPQHCRWLATVLLLLCSSWVIAAAPLADAPREINLTPELQYLVVHEGAPSLAEVMALPASRWRRASDADAAGINLGFTQDTIWVKATLSKARGSSSDWIVEIPYVGLTHADLLLPDGTVLRNGAAVPVNQRPYHSRFYAFPIRLSETPQTFYLKVQSAYPVTIALQATERTEHNRTQFTDNLLQFIYYGGLLSLLVYNLVLYLIIRDGKYLLYSLFTAFTGLGVFAGNGYAELYLWPNAPDWSGIAQTVLFSFAGGLGLIFTIRFLKTYQRLPIANRVMTVFAAGYGTLGLLLLASLSMPIPRELLYQSVFVVSLLAPIVALCASIQIARSGVNSALYFLVAWGVLCLGVLVAVLRMFGLMPTNNLTLYAVQLASGAEMLIFSFALAYRFQYERQQRESAQSAMLASKEEVLQTVRASEDRLERAVEERTVKLQKLLLSEQHMREQYVRFGAMIAHEFRNPLNTIASQTSILEMDPEPSADKLHKRTSVIRSAVNRLVLLFDQWLESDRLNMAATHINLKPVGLSSLIADLLDTCLAYHADHDIVLKPIAADVTITADEHLLQIALLNLIDNACKYSPPNSLIEIHVMVDPQYAGICIKDAGCGIPADMMEAILEPYTRVNAEQGAITGSGLGLAFVNRIVALHHGRIVIDSKPGAGTSITLWLPMETTL